MKVIYFILRLKITLKSCDLLNKCYLYKNPYFINDKYHKNVFIKSLYIATPNKNVLIRVIEPENNHKKNYDTEIFRFPIF